MKTIEKLWSKGMFFCNNSVVCISLVLCLFFYLSLNHADHAYDFRPNCTPPGSITTINDLCSTGIYYLFIFGVSINEVVLSYYKKRYWIILINVLIYDSNSSIFEGKKNQLIEKFLSTAGLILLGIFLILCKLGFWGTTFKMFIY